MYEEKNKYEEIDVKQAIYYIREAWREVSKQTIKNCWKKTRITNDEENEDVVHKYPIIYKNKIKSKDKITYTDQVSLIIYKK